MHAPHPMQSLLSEAVEEFIAAGTNPAEQQIRNLVSLLCMLWPRCGRAVVAYGVA